MHTVIDHSKMNNKINQRINYSSATCNIFMRVKAIFLTTFKMRLETKVLSLGPLNSINTTKKCLGNVYHNKSLLLKHLELKINHHVKF